MKDFKDFNAGQKVTYIRPTGEHEHGIVKSVQCNDYVFVVYNCAGEWDRYRDYTAARTPIDSLVEGWR